MSLKTYIDGVVQDFRKKSAPNIQFGLQTSPTFKLLPIYEAYKNGGAAVPTEITAVKIENVFPFREVERVVLPTNLIIFDSGTDQYVIDNTKTIAGLLDEDIYYLEFKNGFSVFTTEAFLVKISDYPITWDLSIITWDSTLITFDNSHITI